MKLLQKFMQDKKIDFSIFFSSSDDPNYLYFTKTDAYGILIVPAVKPPFILSNVMEIERLKQGTLLKVHAIKKKDDIKLIVQKKLGNIKKIGINKYNLLVATLDSLKSQFKKTSFVDVGITCNKIRSIKTEDEIKTIKKACFLSDQIFSKLINNFNFKTEREIANFIEFEAKKKGYSLSFPTIVASGSNASMPHHNPDGKLKRGFCVVDFGVRYKGYCADMTRTIFLGKPTKEEKEIYNDMLKAQTELIKAVKPGIKARVLFDLMYEKLHDYKDGIIHDLGHGVGIDVHEIPSLSSNIILKENMIITIEPGIYYKERFGIRIEDDILIKENPIVLTKSNKQLIIRNI